MTAGSGSGAEGTERLVGERPQSGAPAFFFGDPSGEDVAVDVRFDGGGGRRRQAAAGKLAFGLRRAVIDSRGAEES
ncbi:hypothetical protein Kpho02_60420 [Kitasatospora phosalacinea]|uniref:Uncharacterized protein n=1 Tax=Kitasatospora phosalacinea TaxID=2065 RepID=A0A9W6V2Z9_9ACTN|nr:hypothetical protein Kpho02_60420 [Kitasatospora phosalacinea]